MKAFDIRLPVSIYQPDAVSAVLAEGFEIEVVEHGRFLGVTRRGDGAADPGETETLAELLTHALRVSIEARVPALRPEDE